LISISLRHFKQKAFIFSNLSFIFIFASYPPGPSEGIPLPADLPLIL
jgi:hypothetical protein